MKKWDIFSKFGKWYVKKDGYSVKFKTLQEAEEYVRDNKNDDEED